MCNQRVPIIVSIKFYFKFVYWFIFHEFNQLEDEIFGLI